MRKTVYGILLVALGTGCKKMLELDPPADRVVYATAFADDATATATVNGLYARMVAAPQHVSSFGFSLYPGLMADELYNPAPSATYDAFTAAKLHPGLSPVTGMWTTAYQHIYHVNNCLEGLAAATSLTDSVRTRLLGEMRFMRAFFYNGLANLFGDVPLVLATDYEAAARLPRNLENEVRAQVLADLEEAAAKLPVTYPVTGRFRPNRYTALALLARLHLQREAWAEAEAAATAVIGSGFYSLPALGNVFLSTSPETVWQLSTSGLSYNTYEGNFFIPASATVVPVMAVTSHLLNDFEPADNRRTAWLAKNTVGTAVYYYPFKYKVRTGSTQSESPVYFRLAEQYLVRAEARAHLGNLDGAREDLDRVRTRAGLPKTVAATKEQLLAAILHERRVELFAEWGHRWFDLKRTGALDGTLSPIKPAWQAWAARWPVPAAQLELNPSLTQNPGY